MTFRHFLDASYALLVEGYLTVAPNRIDLLSAVEKVDSSWEPLQAEKPPPKKNVAAENTAALLQLKAQMASVQGAPRV